MREVNQENHFSALGPSVHLRELLFKTNMESFFFKNCLLELFLNLA
jgi:hypothetical protein